ncbi:hypothetical protein [Falsiroseomonas sp.]|uniref:hypothetical protein n=1 Tax=Falsiroseomonas sp. TaxID=2870721 RepID=UPI003F7261EF
MDAMPLLDPAAAARRWQQRRLDALLMIANEASELAVSLSMQPDGTMGDYGALAHAVHELAQAEELIAQFCEMAPVVAVPPVRPVPRTPEMAVWVAGVAGLGFGA